MPGVSRERTERLFFEKVYADPNTGCWLWGGALDQDLYGRFWDGAEKKLKLAHRFSLEVSGVSIPAQFEVDHKCKVKMCVNPSHLEPVTRVENNIRSNSFSSVNKRKAFCKRGHSFDEENTRVISGHRICKACDRIRHSKNYNTNRNGAR